MEPITQKVHAKKAAPSKVCPSCMQPIGQACGCPSRGPIKYNSPVHKQSCKY